MNRHNWGLGEDLIWDLGLELLPLAVRSLTSLGHKDVFMFHILSSVFHVAFSISISIPCLDIKLVFCLSCSRSPHPPPIYPPLSLHLSIFRYQACQLKFTASLGGVHIWILFKGNYPAFLPLCWHVLRDINHLSLSGEERQSV